jgi:hypothetical protein
LEDELERRLEAQRLGVPMPSDDELAAAAEIRKLDGGPLEAAAAQQSGEEHEYKGEFYPVDRGAKKHE